MMMRYSKDVALSLARKSCDRESTAMGGNKLDRIGSGGQHE